MDFFKLIVEGIAESLQKSFNLPDILVKGGHIAFDADSGRVECKLHTIVEPVVGTICTRFTGYCYEYVMIGYADRWVCTNDEDGDFYTCSKEGELHYTGSIDTALRWTFGDAIDSEFKIKTKEPPKGPPNRTVKENDPTGGRR